MNDLEASLTPKWLDDCIKEVSIHLGREWLDPSVVKSYNWTIDKQMAKQGDKEEEFVFKNLRDAPWEEPVFIIRGLECSRKQHNKIWNIGEEDIVLISRRFGFLNVSVKSISRANDFEKSKKNFCWTHFAKEKLSPGWLSLIVRGEM